MIRKYKQLFYLIFKLIERINRKFKPNLNLIAHNSIAAITLVLTIYIDVLLRLIFDNIPKYISFIILGIIYIYNLILFYKLDPFEGLVERFDKEVRKRSIEIIFLLVFFCPVIFYLIFLLIG